MNSSRMIALFIVGCICLSSCGADQKSERNKAKERRQAADRAYKERYLFDINNEVAACDKAREIATHDYQITIGNCSWKDRSIM